MPRFSATGWAARGSRAARRGSSVVDVRIYVWEPELEDWRALLREKKLMWEFRGR